VPSVSYSRLRSSPSTRICAPFLESRSIPGQFAPRLDAMPFGSFSALAVLEERGLGGEGEVGDGLPVLGVFRFGSAAEEANEFNAIKVHVFFSF
jgi:hypothetical protein